MNYAVLVLDSRVYNTWPKWSPADRFVFLMSSSTITGLPGAPEVYASAQRTAHFPTAQLISLADAEDDGGRHRFEFITGHYFAMAGTGSSSS